MKKLLDNVELYIAGLGLFVMLGITFANVIGRYLLPVAWSFTEELVCALFILVTLLGAAAVAKNGGHIGLSALTDLLPQKYQKYITAFQSFTTLIFSVLLFWYGISMVQEEIGGGIKTASLGWPEAIFGSFIPLGAAFIAVRTVQHAIDQFKKPKEEPNEGGASK